VLTLKKDNRRPRQSGSTRGGFILFLAVIGFLWAGGQKVYTFFTNREPTVMSYEAYVRTKPSASWLTITNCRLDLVRACYLTHPGDQSAPYEYYIPVESRNTFGDTIHILLKTRDPELKATISEAQNIKPGFAAEAWMEKNRQRIYPRRDVAGLVLSGIEDLKSTQRASIMHAHSNIAPDFVILDENARPNLAAGICCTIAGLALLSVVVIRSSRE